MTAALPVLPALATALAALALLAALAATAWAAGRSLRRWTLGASGPGEGWGEWGIDLALGLALLAHAFWLLALCGVLGRGAAVALVLALHALALLPGGGWRDRPRRRRPAAAGIASVAPIAATVALGAFALPVFLLALYPPTGFDETLYHLPFTRAFAETGRLEILWDLRIPVFPQLAEALSAGPYLAVGEIAPHLVALLATLATAGLILAWGGLRLPRGAGLLAAAIFLGNPIAVHLGTSGYIDPLLMLFVTAAFLAAERGIDRLRAGPQGGRPLGWLVLAGLLGGTAAGTKYLGLFFAGVLALGLLFRAPAAWRWRAPLAFATCAALALAPTYLRLALLTGNPLFPFLPGVFGSTAWDPQPMMLGPEGAPPAPAWLRWLTLPWQALFDRRAVGWQPPFAPWLLAGLPFLLAALWRDPRVRALCLVPLLWSVVFLVLPADVRYLMPVVPMVSLALAAAVVGVSGRQRSGEDGGGELSFAELPARWPAWAAGLLVAVLAAPGALYAVYRLERQGFLPATPAARSAYLGRELPFYRAVEALNLEEGDRYALYALRGENLRFFVRGRLLGDWTNRYPYARVLPLLGDPEALDRQLAEFGATHLALPDDLRQARRTPAEEDAFRRLFAPVYGDAHCTVYRRLRAGAGAGAGSGSRSPSATEKSLR